MDAELQGFKKLSEESIRLKDELKQLAGKFGRIPAEFNRAVKRTHKVIRFILWAWILGLILVPLAALFTPTTSKILVPLITLLWLGTIIGTLIRNHSRIMVVASFAASAAIPVRKPTERITETKVTGQTGTVIQEKLSTDREHPLITRAHSLAKNLFLAGWVAIGIGFLVGLYWTFLPIYNDRRLVFPIILAMMAMAWWGKSPVTILPAFVFAALTIILILGGTDKAFATASNAIPQNTASLTKPAPESTQEIKSLQDQISEVSKKIGDLVSAGSFGQNAGRPNDLSPESLGMQNNNPLDIMFTPLVARMCNGQDSGIHPRDVDGRPLDTTLATFATSDDGIQCAYTMLTNPAFGYVNLTVDAALHQWSRSRKSPGYGAEIVADIPGNTIVSQLTRRQLSELIVAMEKREGSSPVGQQEIQLANNTSPLDSGLFGKAETEWPQEPTDWNLAQRFSAGEYVFEMPPCTFRGANLYCPFRVKNQSDEDFLILYGSPNYPETRLLDGNGGEYHAENVQLGTKRSDWVELAIPSGVPVLGSFTFTNVPSTASRAALIEVEASHGPSAGTVTHTNFTIHLQNVAISRLGS